MDITILYGTETGNAEMLAEDVQSALEDGGHDVIVREGVADDARRNGK